jgi:prepilin-type N-terminal cleavage/methylation domain-containing protein
MRLNKAAFSLIELIVVIGIISLLSVTVFFSTSNARIKARDTKRKADLSQIGKFLASSNCIIPSNGPGDYDFVDLYNEMKVKYPQLTSIFKLPQDPKTGSETKTNYRYVVSDASLCSLYANLENTDEKITLTNITAPTAGGGIGVLKSNLIGVNNTFIYFQFSK